MELSDLKLEVAKLLVTDYSFSPEDAESEVESSVKGHPEMWSENAVPKDLAEFLASDENDD